MVCNVTYADTVWLNNGTKLSGTLIYLDREKLAFQADLIGRVNVSVNDIRTLESSNIIQLKKKNKAEVIRSHLHAGEERAVTLDDRQVILLDDIDSLANQRASISSWHKEGSLDLAINMKQEDHKDAFEANTKMQMQLFNETWRHGLKGEIEKKSEDGSRKDNNYQVTYNLDRFIDEYWFVRAHWRQYRDYMGSNSTEKEVGGGSGYQFWDSDRAQLNLALQLSRLDFRYYVQANQNQLRTDMDIDIAGLELDFRQQIGMQGLELFLNGYANYPYQTPDVDMQIRTTDGSVIFLNNVPIPKIGIITSIESGIRYQITQSTYLSFRYEYEYIDVETKGLIDKRYFLALGIKW